MSWQHFARKSEVTMGITSTVKTTPAAKPKAEGYAHYTQKNAWAMQIVEASMGPIRPRKGHTKEALRKDAAFNFIVGLAAQMFFDEDYTQLVDVANDKTVGAPRQLTRQLGAAFAVIADNCDDTEVSKAAWKAFRGEQGNPYLAKRMRAVKLALAEHLAESDFDYTEAQKESVARGDHDEFADTRSDEQYEADEAALDAAEG